MFEPSESLPDAEAALDTIHLTREDAAQEIMLFLRRLSYVAPHAGELVWELESPETRAH